MFRYFRKVRKTLLREGETTRYLLYAIDKILLVVIEILIALKVNNWNEGQKTTSQKNNLLINVSNALNKDLDQIRVVRADILEKDQNKVSLLSYFNSDRDVSELDLNKLQRFIT